MISTNTRVLATIRSAERPVSSRTVFPQTFRKCFHLFTGREGFFCTSLFAVLQTQCQNTMMRDSYWTMMVKDIPLWLRDAHTNGFITWSIPQCTSHQWQLAGGLSAYSREVSFVRNPINSNQKKQQKYWSSSWDNYALHIHPYQNNLG